MRILTPLTIRLFVTEFGNLFNQKKVIFSLVHSIKKGLSFYSFVLKIFIKKKRVKKKLK